MLMEKQPVLVMLITLNVSLLKTCRFVNAFPDCNSLLLFIVERRIVSCKLFYMKEYAYLVLGKHKMQCSLSLISLTLDILFFIPTVKLQDKRFINFGLKLTSNVLLNKLTSQYVQGINLHGLSSIMELWSAGFTEIEDDCL